MVPMVPNSTRDSLLLNSESLYKTQHGQTSWYQWFFNSMLVQKLDIVWQAWYQWYQSPPGLVSQCLLVHNSTIMVPIVPHSTRDCLPVLSCTKLDTGRQTLKDNQGSNGTQVDQGMFHSVCLCIFTLFACSNLTLEDYHIYHCSDLTGRL